jgi:protein-tyrosine phosphatase
MSVLEQENNLENIELSDNANENTQKSYIEFSNYKKNDSDNDSDNDSNNDSTQSNNDNNIIDKINLDDPGTNIIYNIIRYFDDLYVSGRTHIENNYFNLASNEDFNLVYPNIYVGNYSITTNLDLLKGLGITHIISVIPTFNPAFEDKFKYLFIQAYDDNYQDIKQYFDITNEFIKTCLYEGGKILIHCMAGCSRSVSIFIAFLIYILKGGINQCIVRIDEDNNTNNFNEVCNLIEYKKLIENKKIKTTSKSYMDSEQITSNVQELPKLSKKEENFIIYKKQKMINDIEDIISNYNLLTKELNNFKNTTFVETEETQELYANTKAKFAAKIFSQLLIYVKSHRAYALPNDNFINQLCNIIY